MTFIIAYQGLLIFQICSYWLPKQAEK